MTERWSEDDTYLFGPPFTRTSSLLSSTMESMSQEVLGKRQFSASVVPRVRQIPGQLSLPGMDEHTERMAAITRRVPHDDPYRTDLIAAYVHGGLPTSSLRHLPDIIKSVPEEGDGVAYYHPGDDQTPQHIGFRQSYLKTNPDNLYLAATHEAAHAFDSELSGYGAYSGIVRARAEGSATGVETQHRRDEESRYGVSIPVKHTNGYDRDPGKHFGLSTQEFSRSRQRAFEEAGGSPLPPRPSQAKGQIPMWLDAM